MAIFIFVSATRLFGNRIRFSPPICLNTELTSSHKLSNTDNPHGTIFDPYRTYLRILRPFETTIVLRKIWIVSILNKQNETSNLYLDNSYYGTNSR